MKAKEVLDKIKVMLSSAVRHTFEATKTLVDGTEVYVEGEFAIGEALFVITEDGLIQAPAGNHETNDGFIVSVDEAGIITAIEPVNGEELKQVQEVENQEVVVKEDDVDDMVIVNETTENELVETIVEALKPLIDEMTQMRKELKKYKEKMEKFAAEPAAEPIKSSNVEVKESAFQKRLKLLTEKRKTV